MNRELRRAALAVALMSLTATATAAAAGETLTGPHRLIDADTIDVAGERVRLEGIDAPERGQRCRDAAGRCYRCGKAATEALRRRVGAGAIRCEVSGRDRYGRALGTCYAADGANLQGWLVRSGHALAYRSTRYVPEEDAARTAGAGMHAGAFVAPWRWRRHERLNPRCPK